MFTLPHGPVGDEGDEHTSKAGTWTNVLGRFRTIDVVRIVAREGARLDPQRVEFTVEKSGYEMVRRMIRTRGRETQMATGTYSAQWVG